MQSEVKVSGTISRILQIFLFLFIIVIDHARSVGFLGKWSEGNLNFGICIVVGGLVLSHFGFNKKDLLFSAIWTILGLSGVLSVKSWYIYVPGFSYIDIVMLVLGIWIWGLDLTKLIPYYVHNYKDIINMFSWKNNRVSFLLLISWVLLGILSVIGRDSSQSPLMILIIFTLLYSIKYSDEEKESLFLNMSLGFIAGFWVLQVFAFGFRPFDSQRYKGMYFNSSAFSLLCLLVVVISLNLMRECERKGRKYCWILAAINTGLVFASLLLTIGRWPIIVAFIAILVYLVELFIRNKKNSKQSVKNTLILILCIVLCFPTMFLAVRYLPTILKHPVWFGNEYFDETIVEANASADAENYTDFDEFLETAIGRMYYLIGNKTPKPVNSKPQEDPPRDPNENEHTYYLNDEYSSTELRYAIWRTFLDEANFLGHSKENQIVWIAPTKSVEHAHNMVIQMVYSYGIIAGVVCIVWIFIGFYGIISIVKQKKSYAFGTMLIFGALLLYGLADAMWQLGQASWFLLLFIQIFLLQSSEQKDCAV